MTELDELLEREHAGWRALCDGTGAEFYGASMSPDGVMVLANGMVLDRAGVVASLADAPPWAGYRIEEPRLVSVGDDARALIYTGIAWRAADRSDEFRAVMCSTYVRTDDGWRLATYQQTPVG